MRLSNLKLKGDPSPLLAHIHVPKCAGSSVRKVLDEIFGPAHLHLYMGPTTFVMDEDDLTNFVADPAVKAYSSHFVRRFPPRLGSRPVHYVTFLRDPVQQFLSYVRYTRYHYGSEGDIVLRSYLPPGMDKLTLRECTRWILSGDASQWRNFRENYVTNFFARYVVQQRDGYSYADKRYRKIRLRTSREVLDKFLFVGISERLDDSWRVMRSRCAQVGINLPEMRMPRENVLPKETAEDLSWLHPDDEVGGALLRSVAEDTRLYSSQCERLEYQLRKLEPPRKWSRLRFMLAR